MVDFKGNPNAVDELVCFQEAQVLPLFLLKLKNDPKFNSAMETRPSSQDPQPPPSPNAGSGSKPTITRATFEKLKTQALIDYLIAQRVELEEEDIAIFKKHRISGEALMEASKEDLERYGLPGGVVKRIPKE